MGGGDKQTYRTKYTQWYCHRLVACPPEAGAADDEFLLQKDMRIHLINLLSTQQRAEISAAAVVGCTMGEHLGPRA